MACLIYFHTDTSDDDVVSQLAELLGLERDAELAPWALESPAFYISVRRNELAEEDRSFKFPDGFLHFPAYVEFSASDDVAEEEAAQTIGHILRYFWDRGIPAVAECSFDEALPLGGGYGRSELPWPRATEEADS